MIRLIALKLNSMAPFRWPETYHDLALAKKVARCMPEKSQEGEEIAKRLSEVFSTERKQVELKGRGCRERMDRLLERYKTEDAKALKRYV